MSFTLLLAMFSLSLVMSISPGPVNMMIISSGINHGFRPTFLFISGATIGFTLLLIMIALGLSKVYEQYSDAFSILEVCGALFICYMGYKIATSKGDLEVKSEKQYLKFHEGFLLQWLNPKAWIACISGVSMFSQSQYSLMIFITIYFFVCYASLSFWGILGQKATYFLNTNRRLQNFNMFMGGILILSASFIVLSHL